MKGFRPLSGILLFIQKLKGGMNMTETKFSSPIGDFVIYTKHTKAVNS